MGFSTHHCAELLSGVTQSKGYLEVFLALILTCKHFPFYILSSTLPPVFPLTPSLYLLGHFFSLSLFTFQGSLSSPGMHSGFFNPQILPCSLSPSLSPIRTITVLCCFTVVWNLVSLECEWLQSRECVFWVPNTQSRAKLSRYTIQ